MFFYAIVTKEEIECWWEPEPWGPEALAKLPEDQKYFLAFGEGEPGDGDPFGIVEGMTDVVVNSSPCTEGGIIDLVFLDDDWDHVEENEEKKRRIFRRYEELLQEP